jgi:acid phosphatase family membrane protein YuiD
VVLDASSLRREVGKHASVLNRLAAGSAMRGTSLLRERMGHRPVEIAAGVLVGVVVATAVHWFARLGAVGA